jgi:oligopeptide/dipeptide ABC transporter ATP-binding protein
LIVITHDLGVVAGMADRVAVMYAGQVVESGPVDDIFYRSHHPYTEALMASLPSLEVNATRLKAIDGSPPTLLNRPSGCAFHPRCGFARPLCAESAPALRTVDSEVVACHFAEEVSAAQGVRPMKRTRTNG